jgi:hypothetical protein
MNSSRTGIALKMENRIGDGRNGVLPGATGALRCTSIGRRPPTGNALQQLPRLCYWHLYTTSWRIRPNRFRIGRRDNCSIIAPGVFGADAAQSARPA